MITQWIGTLCTWLVSWSIQEKKSDVNTPLLIGLPDDLPRDQRNNALNLARQHNLVVERVAVATADLIAKNAIKVTYLPPISSSPSWTKSTLYPQELPPLRGGLPTIPSMSGEPTSTELRLVRSVQWLLFNEETWQTAIYQSNAVLRYMLGKSFLFRSLFMRTNIFSFVVGMGRINAARTLIQSLPESLASSSTSQHGGELLGYIKFFGVWDAIPALEAIKAQDPGEDGTKAEKRAWEKEYKVRCLFRVLIG